MQHTRNIDLGFLLDEGDCFVASDVIARMVAADGVVERLGASGADAVIQAATDRCTKAYSQRDARGVNRECAVIEKRATELHRTSAPLDEAFEMAAEGEVYVVGTKQGGRLPCCRSGAGRLDVLQPPNSPAQAHQAGWSEVVATALQHHASELRD